MDGLTLQKVGNGGNVFFLGFSRLIILTLVLEGETLAASMARHKIVGHLHQSHGEVP